MFRLKKKGVFIILFITILIVGVGGVRASDIDFKDISGHWAREIIISAANQGIITGYTDGTFKPDNMISVKEALALVGRYAISNQELINNQVADYKIEPDSKNWGFMEVNFAMDRMPMNIFAGSESSRAITREETAYIISHLFKGIEGIQKVQISDINNSKFQNEVNKLVAGGIISGFPDGSFKPKLQITRAELTSLLFKFVRNESPLITDETITNESQLTIDLINDGNENEDNFVKPKTTEINKDQSNTKFQYTNNFTELFNSDKIIDFDELRDEFMYLLNKEREANGVAPITLGEHLRRGTETRAIELAEHGYHRTGRNYDQSHKRLDGVRSFRTAFDYLPSYDRCNGCSLGENVLVYTYTPGNERYSAQDPKYVNDVKFIAKYLFDIWKGSEGHYRNMMSSSYKTTWLEVKVSGVIYNYGTEKKDYPLHTILAVQVFDSQK